MIRSFMRFTFPKILDVLFILCAVVVVLYAVVIAITTGSMLGFLLTLLVGAISIIMAFGTLYVLLDIRDALNKKASE